MTKCILIIDDEYRIREVTKLSLEMMAEWTVITAASGQEGIVQAQASQPDAILLDMMMPDMDGSETLRHLQGHPSTKQIPVFFLTAKMQTPDSHLPNAGVCGIIAKPFDPLTLFQVIEETLGWSEEN